MGLPYKVKICPNPDCGESFVKTERAQKYCCFKCGDALRSKRYRAAHPDRIAIKVKLNWVAKKDILSARHKAWADKSVEWRRVYNREYRLKRGSEHFRAYSRGWYARNREVCKSYLANRKAQKKSRVPVSQRLTPEGWAFLLDLWEHTCAYCGDYLINPTQDHVIPFAKGGKHTLDNVVPACKWCNGSKSDRDVEEFRESLRKRGLLRP